MSAAESTQLTQEWTTLQDQFDSYEKFSLIIKLFSIAWLIISIILIELGLFNLCASIAIAGILWLQDAIWKTFQSRIESRLLKIEASIADKAEITPCQFNREFIANRGGTVSTLVSYLKQALRPTIAYPHVVIVTMMVAVSFI